VSCFLCNFAGGVVRCLRNCFLLLLFETISVKILLLTHLVTFIDGSFHLILHALMVLLFTIFRIPLLNHCWLVLNSGRDIGVHLGIRYVHYLVYLKTIEAPNCVFLSACLPARLTVWQLVGLVG